MSETHGKVWWTELMTNDIGAAKEYYAKTCGWTFVTMPMGESEYHLAMIDGVPMAGMTDVDEAAGSSGIPVRWMSYFAVDDVDAAVAATSEAGGTVLRAPFDVPGTGRIALLIDPVGAEMGLMTPEPMAEQ